MNRTAVKLDGIQGGDASYPGKPSWAEIKSCRDRIKPNRVGEPEAGQGPEGGRSTGITEDSGPMKPGNSVEGKILTIRKFEATGGLGMENPLLDSGTIDPTPRRS